MIYNSVYTLFVLINKAVIEKNVKTQSTEWEEIFVTPIYDKGLVLRIHNKLLQFDNKK